MQAVAASLGIDGLLHRYSLVLREHCWFLGVMGLYLISALSLAWWYDVLPWMSLSLYAANLFERYAQWMMIFALGYVIYVMAAVRPKQLIRYLIDDVTSRFLTVDRLFSAAIVLAVLPLFVSIFTSVKIMIPLVHPFDWDVAFMTWDRLLHGGYHPWELLQPILGYPLISHFLNIIYHLWFFVLYAIICWQAFARVNPLLRMQYFISMLLTWALLGNLAATVFASAGPCYFGPITGLPDPFLPLMDYLRAADETHTIWSLMVQDLLWQDYQSGALEQGRGISAMPSMHIGAVMLNLLFGWRIHRLLGWSLAVFAFLTFLGSIHLGWHYAIDGYAAALGTVVIWYAVGWCLRRDRIFRVPAHHRGSLTSPRSASV